MSFEEGIFNRRRPSYIEGLAEKIFDDGLNIEHMQSCISALSHPTEEEQIAHLKRLEKPCNLAHKILEKKFNIVTFW
jgi:hypothetical protein